MKKNKGIIKIAAFAAVIVGALVVVQWYQLKYLASLQETVYVIESAEVAKTLVKGEAPKEAFCSLLEVKEDEAVYRRGNNLYVGQGRDKIEGDFPFYVNDGNALMIMKEDTVLVNTEFEDFDVYQGMYVSDGFSFNYDKSQADEEQFLFLRLPNGLFINTQPILFSYPGSESKVRMNSIFYLGSDGARYYEIRNDNVLQYGEIPTVKMTTVTIGGQTYSYEELLMNLGVIGIRGDKKKTAEEKKPDEKAGLFPDVQNQINQGGLQPEDTLLLEDDADENEGAEIKKDSNKTAEKDNNSKDKKKGENGDTANNKSSDKRKEKNKNNGSNGGNKNSGNNGNSGSSNTANNGNNNTVNNGSDDTVSGNSGGSNDDGSDVSGNTVSGNTVSGNTVSGNTVSGNNSGNSGQGNFDLSGNDVSGNDLSGNDVSGNNGNWELPPTYPTAVLGKFTADVYSIFSDLEIKDLSGTMKRVVVELYWQPANEDGTPAPESSDPDDYKAMYRKTFRSGGEISIDNLPPGTTMYAKGKIYYVEDGETKNYEFYDGFEDRVTTLGLDQVDDLYLTFSPTPDDTETEMLPYQMQIWKFAISGPNPNVLNKISKIRVTASRKDGGGEPSTFQMNLSDAKRNYYYAKPDESPVWVSDMRQISLSPDTYYDYSVVLLDTFGNRFTHVVEGYQEKDDSIDWEENKSLNCCEKHPQSYFEPKGDTWTAKLEPRAVLNQRNFGDGAKNIDRAKYEVEIKDENSAAATYEGEYYLRVFREDPEGAVQVKFQTKTAGSTVKTEVDELQLTTANVRNGKAEYEIWGLTAGHIYEVRICGSYDLNNRKGKYRDMIIGSQRFSTVTLASYGRVSYDFTSSHVKTEVWPDGRGRTDEEGNPLLSPYESATAQKISMSINYSQTIKDLVDLYMDHVSVEVNESATGGKSILTAVLQRSKMQEYKIEGTGTGGRKEFEVPLDEIATDISSTLKDGYLPKVYLEAADFAPGTPLSVWELYSAPGTKLIFYWEEGSLTSITGYQVNTLTYASQGGEIHDVTGRVAAFRQMQFTTLKKMPYVTYDDVLMASDYVKIYGLKFHDVDHAIADGIIEKSLVGISSERLTLDYETEAGGVLTAPLEYNKLAKLTNYQITLAAVTIRRDTAGRYTLRSERLLTQDVVVGEGLEGELVFEGISYPLEPKEGDGADVVRLKSEYSLYNASGYRTGLMDSVTGVAADTERNSNWNWVTSPYIKVNPGEVYYLSGLRSVETQYSIIQFYEDVENPYNKEEKRPVRMDTTNWIAQEWNGSGSRHYVYSDSAIVIPEGVSYMRFAMYDSVNQIPNYATANCFDLTKAEAAEKLEKIPQEDASGGPRSSETAGEQVYPVTPGERYGFMMRNLNYTVQFLDKNGTGIGSPSDTISWWGYNAVAPAEAAYVKVKCLSTYSAYWKTHFYGNFSVYHLMEEKLEWLNSRDISRFANSITVEVKDKKNNLIQGDDNKVYLDIYRNDVLLTGKDSPLSDDIRQKLVLAKDAEGKVTFDLKELVSFVGEANQNFRLELYVYYHGEKVLLDTVTYKTNQVLETIHDRTELAKLMRYPNGDFMVVRDIELRENENFYYGNDLTPFQGYIDFQGHTLKMKNTVGSYGIYRIGNGAVIENFVLDYTIDCYAKKQPIEWTRGLAVTNYGTIRNFIVNLNLGQGMYRKKDTGGLCETNYGLIENFAVSYSASSSNYVGYGFGGLCRYNYPGGVIRNGYAYCPGVLNVTTGVYGGTGCDGSISNAYTGLLVGFNDGKMENVYVSGSLAVEDYATDHKLPYNSLLAGRGTNVSNCFTIGELYKTVWKEEGGRKVRDAQQYTAYGPALPGTIGGASQNNYYYTSFSVPYERNVAGRHEQITDASVFQDQAFYERTIGRAGSFELSDVKNGRLPRVIMMEEMMLMQPRIPLTILSSDSQVRFMYGQVDGEVHEGNGSEADPDYVYATLTFRNRLERKINSIQVNGLKVVPREGTEFEQMTEDGFYRVKVKLIPDGTIYSDRYSVTGFTYADKYTAEVSGQLIYATFAKPVTQANWCDAFTNKAGYYRLAEDIDFTKFADQEKAAAVLATGDFTGSLDGRNHTLKNFTLSKYPYLIGNLSGGKLFDLRVENMTITAAAANNNDYRGLVGQCQNNAEMKGIVLKNVTVGGVRHYAGTLAGVVRNSSVSDCVVSGVSLETTDAGITLRVGGLVGRIESTRLENCFVKGLKLTAKKGGSVTGIGGLVGDAPSGNFIENVYAQGTIDSSFSNTGGLVGNLNGMLSSAWAKVNINSSSTYAGGAVGLLDSSGGVSRLLAIGEVFTSASDRYGRIVGGYYGSTRRYLRCYASADQKINSEVSEELLGAVGLMTEEELMQEFHYWDKPNIGSAFDYDVVTDGNLPLLYYKGSTTELLPEQKIGVSVSAKGVSFTAEGDAKVIETEEKIGEKKAEYELTVTLTFEDALLADRASFDQNAWKIFGGTAGNISYENLSIENMEFGKEDGKIKVSAPAFRTEGDKKYCILTFTGVQALKYVDSYRVVLETAEGQNGTKLVFSEVINGKKTETPLYYHIYRAEDEPEYMLSYTVDDKEVIADINSWQGAMRLAGYSYENFLIMKDLDFSGVSSGNLLTRLKINRLEGNLNRISLESGFSEKEIKDEYLMAELGGNFKGTSTKYAEIRNLTFTQGYTAEVSWIYELRSSVAYLHFKDITWSDTTRSSTYVGIFGRMGGTAKYVDIEKLTLNYGNTTDYTGFIAYCTGAAEYVRGRDISMKSGTGATGRLYYAGGIAGWSRETLRHVGIKGEKTADGTYTYSIKGSGTNGDQTGGMAGRMEKGAVFAYADCVEVTGYKQTGGIAGVSVYYDIHGSYSWTMVDALGVYLTEAKNCRVTGNTYSGGCYGYGGLPRYSLSENNYVYAQKSYAGGFAGTVPGVYNKAFDCVVQAGESYAGGISGTDGNFNQSEVGGCTISAPKYAGGLGSYMSTVSSYWVGYVHDCAIYGDSDVGGLVGYLEGTQFQSGYVKHCVIGRKAKSHPEAKKVGETYQFEWVPDGSNTASYVGGMAGESVGSSFICTVVDDVEIYAGSYGGGAIGSGGGGNSYNLEIDADVHVTGNFAGGYAGEIIGYIGSRANGAAMTIPVTQVSRSIITGTVCAGEGEKSAGAIGGFAGSFKSGTRALDPETGDPLPDSESGYKTYMDRDNYYRIVLAQEEVYGNVSTTGIITGVDDSAGGTVDASRKGIGYLRIYGAMIYQRDGQTVKEGQGKVAVQPSWAYNAAGIRPEDPCYVTTENLKNRYFYYGELAKGGLYLTGNTTWENASTHALSTGNFRNFLYTQEAEGNGKFPYVARWTDTTRRTPYELDKALIGEDPHIQTGILIPQDTATAFLSLSMGDALEQVSVYASGAGSVNLEFPTDLVMEEDDVEMTGEGIAGIDAESGADTMGDGGEEADSGGDAMEDDSEAFFAGYSMMSPQCYFRIYDGNGKLLHRETITRQVYTIPYDYQTTLTVKVTAGQDERSYALTGEALKHTVMTYDDHCYYLKADGIYRDKGASADTETINTEKVLSGDFIHLYQGKALDKNGQIYDVRSGNQAGSLTKVALFILAERAKPAYETTFDGQAIEAYRLFSVAEGNPDASYYRLFAKNGKLFGVDPELDQPYGRNFQSFVADYYSTSQGSTEYHSVLTENMVLKDYKTPINWPVDENRRSVLDNFQICEVGDNLNASQPYVILRYQDNTAAAFNYLTGSLLFVDDSEKEDVTFLEYANMWLMGKAESLNTVNAYNSASGLVGSLASKPIDDSLIVNYLKDPNTEGGTADTGSNVLDIATDGTNKTAGDNEETGSSEEGSAIDSSEDEKGTQAGGSDGNGASDSESGYVVRTEESGTADGSGAEVGNGTITESGSAAEAAGAIGSGAEATDGTGDGNGIIEASDGTGDGSGIEAANGTGNGEGSGIEAANGTGNGNGIEAADGIGKGYGSGVETADGTGEESGIEAANGTTKGDGSGIRAESRTNGGSGSLSETGKKGSSTYDSDEAEDSADETAEGAAEGSGDGMGMGMGSPSLTSDRAYVTMLTAKSEGYEVFRASELLNRSGSAILSENQKLKLLEENGLMQSSIDLDSMKLTNEENRTGLILVGAAALSMLILLGVLYRKKRAMSQM